jgi:hypothetical protein
MWVETPSHWGPVRKWTGGRALVPFTPDRCIHAASGCPFCRTGAQHHVAQERTP